MMPQFYINRNARYDSLDDFARGYIEAMFFTNGDTASDDDHSLNRLGTERLTRASLAAIKRDCDAFIGSLMPDGCFVRQWLDRLPDYDDEQAGRDFWFTRQGHGVGFWDRSELSGLVQGESFGEHLSRVAKSFGESYVDVYRGWIYVN